MKDIVIHNVLKNIIDLIRKIHESDDTVEFVWGGQCRHLPLINSILEDSNIFIGTDIDLDESLWGHSVQELFYSDYYKRLLKEKYDNRVIIEDPQKVVTLAKNQVFILAHINIQDLKGILINLGVSEKQIFCYDRNALNNPFWQSELHDSRLKRLNLTEMQSLEFRILKEFRDFCNRNDLKYFLSSGTLLGAVRHKGFIPWDDDVDVYMPYEDFLHFMKIYRENENYKAVYWDNDEDYYFAFGKLVSKDSVLFHDGFPLQSKMGVYIDVFPLAGYGKDDVPEFWQRNVDMQAWWFDCYTARCLLGKGALDIRKEIIDERYRYSFYDPLIDTVGAKHYLAQIPQWCAPKHIYEARVDLEFEGEMFSSPAGYDELLTIRYKDYMKLPPVEKRTVHSFNSFRIVSE